MPLHFLIWGTLRVQSYFKDKSSVCSSISILASSNLLGWLQKQHQHSGIWGLSSQLAQLTIEGLRSKKGGSLHGVAKELQICDALKKYQSNFCMQHQI